MNYTKLKNAHTRVIKHFEGIDLDDVDACVLSLENAEKEDNHSKQIFKFFQNRWILFYLILKKHHHLFQI